MPVKSKTNSQAPDLSLTSENTKLLGRAFWAICSEYGLTSKDQMAILGVSNRQTLNNLKRSAKISQSYDSYRRVSLLLGVKKNLEILFPMDSDIRANWLHVVRDTFKGHSALDFVAIDPVESQARLFTVRRLLDMLRNGSIPELT